MKSTLLKTILVASVLTISASATIIDNFNSPIAPNIEYACASAGTGSCLATNTNNPIGGLPGASTMSGTRLISASIISFTGGGGAASIAVGNPNGVLNAQSDIGVDPGFSVSYFISQPPDITPISPVNLIANGENLVHVKYVTDTGYSMVLNLNGTGLTIQLPSKFTDVYVPLGAFSNLNTVVSGFFTLNANQSGGDIQIDLIETTTPEPMTFAMMGAGLLALGALRLRKRS